jgi:hypothetical protein
MTWAPEISTVNQRTQIGPEATPGTAVTATKHLDCFDFVYGIDPTVSSYRPSGTKYDASQEEDTEMTSISVTGNLDYNGVIYLLSSAMGVITPTAANSSTTAKQWKYIPPVSGSIQPQTYSIEQGDATRARKFNYGLLSDFGYKGTRKAPFTVSGKGFGQPLTDDITLTASPTDVALAQAVEKQFDVYLDPTSGALGTTQLLRVLSIDYSFGGIYGPFFALNRSTTGHGGHVDLGPKTSIKILMEADSAGMAPLSYLRQGTIYYLRVDALGAQIASDGGAGTDPIYNGFTHDMAIKFGKPSAFKDDQGIFALEWECNVVQDPTWGSGQAQEVTVTNLITAL